MACQVDQRFRLRWPATVRPIQARKPCLWHCGRKRQGDGIPRHAAGIHGVEQSEQLSWKGLRYA